MTITLRISRVGLVIALLLLLYPLVVPPFWVYQIGAQSLVLGTVALSLMLLAGYGGMVSLAQLTVAGVAGYATAYFGVNGVNIGLPLAWPLTVAVALCLGTLAGTLIGMVSVRTHGIYTIMITLAIAVAFSFLARQNYSIFNGFTGFNGVVPPVVHAIDFKQDIPFYYLALAVAGTSYLGVRYLARTPFGLALQGIRENPRRMRALGFDVTRHRVAAFAIAGLIASAAGVLSVWYFQRISPGSVGVGPVIDILVIAVVGGLGHPAGAYIGAIVFTLVDNFAIDLIDRERFNTLIGLTFLFIVLVSPDGLVGIYQRLRATLTAKVGTGRGRLGLRMLGQTGSPLGETSARDEFAPQAIGGAKAAVGRD